MAFIRKRFDFGKEMPIKPMKEYHSICREEKKNHITITIYAESEEQARKLMYDMKKAVRKSNRHMDNIFKDFNMVSKEFQQLDT